MPVDDQVPAMHSSVEAWLIYAILATIGAVSINEPINHHGLHVQILSHVLMVAEEIGANLELPHRRCHLPYLYMSFIHQLTCSAESEGQLKLNGMHSYTKFDFM